MWCISVGFSLSVDLCASRPRLISFLSGPLYYMYMSLLSTFCTNSINILAGVNGVEVRPSSLRSTLHAEHCLSGWPSARNRSLDRTQRPLVHFLRHLSCPGPFLDRESGTVDCRRRVGTRQRSAGGPPPLQSLLHATPHWCVPGLDQAQLVRLARSTARSRPAFTFAECISSRFPAKAFIGDTLCYFAGMAFAVVGILGHFSKTLLLFFIPQVFNFIYSAPQLFGLLPCPRHRLPAYNSATGLLEPSYAELPVPPSRLKAMALSTLESVWLVALRRSKSGQVIACSNLTILNLILVRAGSMSEENLTLSLMGLQVLGSGIAMGIRHGGAGLFYDSTRR